MRSFVIVDYRQGVVNSLRMNQDGRQFVEDVFKSIFRITNVRIGFKFSLEFSPKGMY